MTEARLLPLLALALIAAGCIVLAIATGSEPAEFRESWLYLLFAAVALFGAGLGVFAAMFASALLGVRRIHRAERAADRGGAAPPLADEGSRMSLDGHRPTARDRRR